MAEPVINRLRKLIKGLLARYYKLLDNFHRIKQENGQLRKESVKLTKENGRLKEENTILREQNRDYALLRKVFGSKKIDDLTGQAKEMLKAKLQMR